MNIDLIKNSGLQFVSIPINLTDEQLRTVSSIFYEEVHSSDRADDHYTLHEPLYHDDSDLYLKRESVNVEAFDSYGTWIQDKTNLDHTVEVDEESVYTIYGKRAVKFYIDKWCPIPYYRIKPNRTAKFHPGPTSWARVFFEKLESNSNYLKDGFNYCITLLFDTKTDEVESDSVYERPRSVDARDSGNESFRLASDVNSIESFYNSEFVDDWCWEIYTDSDESKSEENKLEYTAIHRVFLRFLDSLNVLPDFRFLSGENELECSLTLDIGNSRTCGLVIEKNSPSDLTPFSFSNARRLKIRNLQRPSEVDDKPFEMQLAFHEEIFGQKKIGYFDYPSLVRLGKQAVNLTAENDNPNSLTSMSSPKRYLWDKSPSKVPWMKITKKQKYGSHEDVGLRKLALFGFANKLSEDGRYLKNNQKNISQSIYSRSSLMMFSIYEILLHTIIKINSYEFRKEQGNSNYRRVLKDIVLTCPTAMTEQEQYDLRKAANDAKDLIQETLGDNIEFVDVKVSPKLPKLNNEHNHELWKYDEATCSQFTFLYGEIVHKYKGRTELFFELNGRKYDNDHEKSINVASIDIGGGTTDLMISNYKYDSNATSPVLTPDPLFWEGFNIAGDDIVKKIVESIFIPNIHKYLSDNGAIRPSDALNIVFGSLRGSASDKIYSRQIANQIATSFAYEAMKIAKGDDIIKVNLEEVFNKHNPPSNGLIEYINKTIRIECNLPSFNLLDIDFILDPEQINKAIRSVVQIIFNQLTFLLSKFNADIVLLSGRPSSLPIISQVLLETFRLSPNKIIKMGDYRFGSWYPFSTPSGYLNDPKSTVCVGALIAHLNNQGRLPGMQIIMDYLSKVGSTAKYIGVINQSNSLIDNKALLVSPMENSGSFYFYGQPVHVGMRQVNSEKWTVSSIYMFDFKESSDRTKYLHQYPLNIRVSREEKRGEFLNSKEIEIIDKEGGSVDSKDFEFKFQTYSFNNSYWKDSGVFVVNIENK